MELSIRRETWDLKIPFRIANAEWTDIECLIVEVDADGCKGRGEAQGIFFLGETIDTMIREVESIVPQIENGVSIDALQELLPRGGARNAIDCALWDLECKRTGKSVWELAGVQQRPVTTVFTIGLEATPELMAEGAAAASDSPVLKIKLDADRPYERLAAIRAARPDATLVVDANQGWDFELLCELLPRLEELNLAMIEQPLPRDGDAELEGFKSPIPIAADESCLDCSEFEAVARRYDMINIKLDKTGGLTEALKLARLAMSNDIKLMVGNMMGTSLSMAPAYVIAQFCEFVDIDGPLLQTKDVQHGLQYVNCVVDSLDPRLWG